LPRFSFTKHLFRYTWVLFAIHYCLKFISYTFNVAFKFSPFGFSIKIKSIMQLFSEAPTTWIYSFGIVALILYFITQSEKEINLIWPQFAVSKFKIKTLPLNKPSRIKVGIMMTLQIISLFVYFKYNTLFFQTVNLSQPPVLLFEESFSNFMSLLIISIIFFELICSILPFFFKTYWIDLINNCVYLIVAIFLFNHPFKEVFINPSYYILKPIASWILIGIIVILLVDLFKILISMIRIKKQV